METRTFQFRARFTDPDGVPQTLRFKNEAQALRFVAQYRAKHPSVRITLERREALIGPWERVEFGDGR